jgi:AhpD family alkylhydroperoxidase
VYGEIRTRLGLGAVPGVFRAMAAVNHDVLVQNWTAFRQTVLEGGLPRTLKQMVGLVVSREHDCPYAVRLHAAILAHLGVAQPVVRDLVESGDSDLVPDSTRTALGFARQYSRDPDRCSPDLLEAAGFTEDDAQELMDTVLLVSGMTRFAQECGLGADGD